jgi:hypothetical protein
MTLFYALFLIGGGLVPSRATVRPVYMKPHPDRRNSIWQPAMLGTLQPLRELGQRPRGGGLSLLTIAAANLG